MEFLVSVHHADAPRGLRNSNLANLIYCEWRDRLADFLEFRSVSRIYGVYLLIHDDADIHKRIVHYPQKRHLEICFGVRDTSGANNQRTCCIRDVFLVQYQTGYVIVRSETRALCALYGGDSPMAP